MKLEVNIKRRKRNKVRQQRARRKQILIDKIVDPAKEPTLYNVQAATTSVMAKTSPFASKNQLRAIGTSNRRDLEAQKTMLIMNISAVPIGKDFSLLESNSEKNSILNPNIMDTSDFANTLNKDILAKDKFPASNDPFYQLDEGVYAPLAYRTPKLSNNKIANLPDLSFVLSNLNFINQNKDFFGKSKYF